MPQDSGFALKDIQPLALITQTPETHQSFVDAVILACERHLQSIGNVKGIVLRKTYATLQAVRPMYVQHIVTTLSRAYVVEFAAMYEDFRKSQTLPSESPTHFIHYVRSHRQEADAHFWKIADNYAEKRKNAFVGKAYRAMRSNIESHLSAIFDIICAEIDRITFVEV